MKYVDFPLVAASIPIEVARWVFPTPGIPTNNTLEKSSKNLRYLKSNTSALLSSGWKSTKRLILKLIKND